MTQNQPQHNTDSDRNIHHPDINADGQRETFTHQPHHDTHIVAIVAMLIIVLGITYVALTDGQSGIPESLRGDDTTDQTAPPGAAGDVTTSSSGLLVPSEEATVTDSDSTADLPNGLPVVGTVARNYTSPAGAGTQHVVISDSREARSDVAATYRQWIEGSAFTLKEEGGAEDSAVFSLAGPEGGQLTIVVTGDRVPTRIQLNYVTGR